MFGIFILFLFFLTKSNIAQKIFFREIAFWAVLNFFPVQKLILCHFRNCKKWNLVKINYVKLIYLISRVFLAWTFLNVPLDPPSYHANV